MAIAVDTFSKTGAASGSSLTFSHTVTGSDAYLVVIAAARDLTPGSVSSVTYNGGALSLLVTTGTFFTFNYLEMWGGIPNDTSGTPHNIVVTYSASQTNIEAGAVSFTGVDQSASTGTAVHNEVGATSVSVTVTSAAGEMVVDGVYEAAGLDLTAGQTEQWTENGSGRGVNAGMETAAGAASVNMSWSIASGQELGIVAVPLKPTSAPLGGGGAQQTGLFRLRGYRGY